VKAQNLLTPTVLALAAATACLPQPPNLAVGPQIGHTRVSDPATGRTYEGPIVALDSTRLDMFDLKSETRISVSVDQPVTIQVYRGQRRGTDAMIENAAQSTAAGVAAGLFTAVVFKAIFGDGFDLGEGAKSALAGGISGGVVGGAFQAWKEGVPAWESISLRQLYDDVSRLTPTRNAAPPQG